MHAKDSIFLHSQWMLLISLLPTHGNLTAANNHYILQTAVFWAYSMYQRLRNNIVYIRTNLTKKNEIISYLAEENEIGTHRVFAEITHE